MPLSNWIYCTDGDVSFVRKTRKKDATPGTKDAEQWAKIYDDYIARFGLSDMYKKLLELMRKKAIYELEFVETGQRFKLTEIELTEAKLKTALSNNGEGLTIEQSLIHLSKWVGFHLNAKKITVLEYFNLMAEYGKANK
jgi:hypothetical protein